MLLTLGYSRIPLIGVSGRGDESPSREMQIADIGVDAVVRDRRRIAASSSRREKRSIALCLDVERLDSSLAATASREREMQNKECVGSVLGSVSEPFFSTSTETRTRCKLVGWRR